MLNLFLLIVCRLPKEKADSCSSKPVVIFVVIRTSYVKKYLWINCVSTHQHL